MCIRDRDDHVFTRKPQLVHPERYERNEHPAAEHDQPPAEAAAAERGTAAGQDDEDRPAVLLNKRVPRRERQLRAREKAQIKDEMHRDHAQNAESAQRVQLPDTSLLFHTVSP